MPQNFVGCAREQGFLLPPDVRDWLPDGHLAWFVIDAVGELDLQAFYGAYRVDGHGRPAYDPAMMVALILYAYARGMRSSRAIERACEDGVAFRVIAANRAPDHATIARFVERHQDALAELFGAVLELCAEAGLVGVGVVAVDGTKVHASASRDQTMGYEQIAREILEEAQAIDAAEDEIHGQARGDELPAEVATSQGRRGWLRDARRRLDQRRAQEARPVKRSRQARLREAQRRLQEDLDVERQANEVKGMRGHLQGYNAQAVTTTQQIVIAAEVMTASPDFGHLEPMIQTAERQLRAAGVTDTLGTVLADAGYWHLDQMQNIVARGTQVLIPPDSSRRKAPRPGWEGGAYALMRSVLATEHGGALYQQRQHMVEPVFADTKFNRRLDRFLRRGRAAAHTEWRLMTATHNLLKLWRHTTAPQPA